MEVRNSVKTNADTISLYDLIAKVRGWFYYVINKWWIILILASVGGSLGIGYANLKPVTYTAKLSFLVEEAKSSGGGLAAIAGQFGFDLGGLGGGGGLLSGDNVLVFLKSTSLIRETLLTPYDSAGTISLADRYAAVYKFKEKWKKNKRIDKAISFPIQLNQHYTRLQDSLLKVMVEDIAKNALVIEKPDKKAAFVQVLAEMKDELLAKYFCERLVKEAIERYVVGKTSRQSVNVNRLQRRADSIGILLNRKTFATASAQEQLLDINPAFKSASVTAEVTGRDKSMLATIYGEVVKNLEISKVALSQETPTIQIVDNITLPLKVNKVDVMSAFLIGFIIALFIAILIITMSYFLKYK